MVGLRRVEGRAGMDGVGLRGRGWVSMGLRQWVEIGMDCVQVA